MESTVMLAAIVLLVLLFLRVPVFVSVLAGGVTYFLMVPNLPGTIFVQRVIAGTESIPLLAIPFFVCAGVFMNYTGVTKRIMNFCSVLLGTFVGGLAQVAILLSTLMGGLSGSNLADAAMEAKMLVPEMTKRGFSLEFSSVVTATSAIITPLIPPGIAMIIYGSIANLSIGKLFVGGVGPGILLCIAMMILVSIISHRRGYKPIRTERATPDEFFTALKAAFLPLCLPIIIIGGIRIGLFTPTEAGAVAIMYSLFLGIIYREMRLHDVLTGIRETVTTSASIMIIIGAASAYAAVKRKDYAVSAVMAQGLLLFAVGVFIRYHMVLSEMKKSFIGGMVGNALSLDWGMLLFVVGALGLCAYGTVMYAIEHLRQTGGALTGEVLLCQWKDLIWSKVKLSSIALTGWVYSVAIAALLLFLFF